ncbi:MAG: transporter substrate-binding domain-containing protein [Marinobacter sp.]|uniref:substrate-binding periplasmic protein n=1 Tax=Marinobacter sp. TaxID=50741 RepID=UPI0034A074F1
MAPLNGFVLGVLFSLSVAPHTFATQHSAHELIFNIGMGSIPPYTIKQEDGSVRGIFWDVLSRIAREYDYSVVATEVPTNRVDDFMLEGRVDVTMRAIEWTRESHRFLFTDPVTVARDVVFTRKDHPLHLETLEDLAGKTLITHLGYSYPMLEHLFESGQTVRLELHDEVSMFRRLAGAKRFDGLLTNDRSGLWIMRKHGWEDEFQVEAMILNESPYRLMLAPRWSHFVALFNRELAEMKENGELASIIASYDDTALTKEAPQ